MKEIKLEKLKIGGGQPPLIIAEMSGNHNQSLERALEIVDAAAAAGAHALKIQTYTAETMTLDSERPEFMIDDPKSLWHGFSLYKLYQQAATPWDWHKPIFERCRQLGLIGFSTPFDATAVDYLESLDTPCYKIASFENNDLPLIRRVAKTGKPVIISTGLATKEELGEAVKEILGQGNKNIVLLKCTSSYPASPENSNLLTIPDLIKNFGCLAGLSDHTLGIGAAVSSVALGASVIEKHFTLRRADGGVDAAFSLEPAELELLVTETKCAWQALGGIQYGPTDQEKGSLRFRRSLYVVKDMSAGEAFNRENIRSIRPGLGISPKHYDELLGKKVGRAIKKGTPVAWDMVNRYVK
ncbi:MAG: pseudaminic acid synthase [Candidatus Margulisbacteria bacterium]|nr:pseudaminic acid synthase [Candidatus Margulisiibacteriota bacterium]